MVILNSFVGEEINSYTKDVILSTIREGKQSQKYKAELIFNRYSLEFLFPENCVIIYDDVFSEDAPLKLWLDDFINAVSKDKEE
ncbi:MAG: hypothetical protein J4G05_05930 [Chlorobi bacterium]|nr:hypothetical protein [Chlorobiota bacterium]